MTSITHILFDLGNTLIYFDGEWPVVFQQALSAAGKASAAMGLPVEEQTVIESLRAAMQDYYEQRERDLIELGSLSVLRRALGDAGAAEPGIPMLENILTAFYSVTQQYWHPVETAQTVLSSLKASGYHLGILSNAAYDPDVQELVDRASFRTRMDFVLTSAAIGLRKPHPGAFRRALGRWGVSSQQVLMVGDTLHADILGARNSGLISVWIREYAGYQRAAGPPELITADYELQHLAELPEWLQGQRL